jgi:hypothetical protein
MDPDQPNFVRKEFFLKHDFTCGCKLCRIENQEGELIIEKRDTILTTFKDHVNSITSLQKIPPNPQLLVSILEELKCLRPSEVVNPFILQPLMQLGLAHYERGEFLKAIPIFEQAIQLCRVLPQFSSVATTLSIAVLKCYISDKSDDADDVVVQRWISNLKQWMVLQYGCDTEWFRILEIIMPSFASQIQQYLV